MNVKAGDLVRSTWDISKGIQGPLGIIASMKDWTRGINSYTTVYVFLFKGRHVAPLPANQLEVMHEY